LSRACVKFSELEGRSIAVWGAGRETRAFARAVERYLPAGKITAALFDGPPDSDAFPGARALAAADASAALAGCDVLVRSPGVSIRRGDFARIAGHLPVTTATSLWLAEHGGAGVLGVTGTKGKSTTAALAAHLARAAGIDVRLAGNIGSPAIELLGESAELVVLELSSYQTADLAVGPETVLFTNLYREHLDWHGSEAVYHADKLRLATLPGVERVVVNGRDTRLTAIAGRPLIAYGVAAGWDAGPTGVTHGGELVVSLDALPLRGEHNALNLAGALCALEQAGIDVPGPEAALAGFSGLDHRLQVVAEGRLTWVDDSISTTPESAVAALAAFAARDVVLIAGGQDRSQEYLPLAQALREARARLITVPTTGPALARAAREAGVADALIDECPDLAAAVALARSRARDGAVVLLSPAAPSFDRFRDYAERGELFARLAREAA